MTATVYFATNRALTGPGEDWRSYSDTVVPPSSAAAMTFGTAFVNNDNLTADTVGAITSIQDLTQGGFSRGALDDLENPGRNLLVFVHGFDNSFENAITRAAFNRDWLAASGEAEADTTVVAFSWPSLGRLLALPVLSAPYRSDQLMAGQSGFHLMTFFRALAPIVARLRDDDRRVFLLAHSMGNWALQSALENWYSHGNAELTLFDEAILAAADEVFDSFDFPRQGRLSGLSGLARHMTILFSEADNVLSVSAALNGVRRLGQDGPNARFDPTRFPPSRYSMIDCTGYRDFDLGFASSHQYYRRSPSVRALIAAIMGRPRTA